MEAVQVRWLLVSFLFWFHFLAAFSFLLWGWERGFINMTFALPQVFLIPQHRLLNTPVRVFLVVGYHILGRLQHCSESKRVPEECSIHKMLE